MRLAISFTNLGPYHLARLRALAVALRRRGDDLIVYETARREAKYPWRSPVEREPFSWHVLHDGPALEDLHPRDCRAAIRDCLERDQPDAVAVAGYVRPECLEALRWARDRRRAAILMSESGARDRPRIWWKEAVKSRRVRRFDAALVGGPRHQSYLVELGFSADRIALGYNAVDNGEFAARAAEARSSCGEGGSRPSRPYFLAVSRFAPEKNLPGLVRAFARYRRETSPARAWELVLCGDGSQADSIRDIIATESIADEVHLPGFLQGDELARWYAWAGAFVLPSRSEPWGLVVNEAAACGLPLLVSRAAGCVETFIPQPEGTTGWSFDPAREDEITAMLHRMASSTPGVLARMGREASRIVAQWGPDRFAQGMIEAIRLAQPRDRTRSTGHFAPERTGWTR